MKKQLTFLAGLMITLLIIGACSSTLPNEDQITTPISEIQQERLPDTTFFLTGENFKFIMDREESPELRIKQGDKVRIEFSSTQGFHDWVLDEFGAQTGRVKEGESTFVEFIADKTGTFEYYCSIGQHRQNGMMGNLIVE